MQMFMRAVADEAVTNAVEYGVIAVIVGVSVAVVLLQLTNAL